MSRLLSAGVLVVLIALCLGAGALGSIATTPQIDGWYRTLAKPSWTPPDAVFGPVWTTLYLVMGIAAWLAWRAPSRTNEEAPSTGVGRAVAMGLFLVQLALNVAWSWIFFGARSPGWAAAEIVVLWLAIAATMVAFHGRSRIAALLMTPYLAWVTFAAALNVAIWRMNAT